MEDAAMESQKVDLTCDSPASSSAREKRWRRRLVKPIEMTEEEMMQRALRLSELEANIQHQEEEGDVRNAIHQSMPAQRSELSHSLSKGSTSRSVSPQERLSVNAWTGDEETSTQSISLCPGEPSHQLLSSGTGALHQSLESQQRAAGHCDIDQNFPNGSSVSTNCSQESLSPSQQAISPTFPRSPHSPQSMLHRNDHLNVRGAQLSPARAKRLNMNSHCGPSEPEDTSALRRLSHNNTVFQKGSCVSDTPEVNKQFSSRCGPGLQDSDAADQSTGETQDEDSGEDDCSKMLSDEDEDISESLSPVFNQEKDSDSALTAATVNGPNSSPARRVAARLGADSCVDLHQKPVGGPGEGLTTVQYYWGVPFCPRSLNPDEYTQVIVSQLDIYSRSLKEAQRFLLKKSEWGDGITPEMNVSSPGQTDEPPQQADSGDDVNQGADAVLETSKGLDEDLQDMDCDVCPETQLSDKYDEDDEDRGSQEAAVQSRADASPDHASLLELMETAPLDRHEGEHENTEDKNNSSTSDVEVIHEINRSSISAERHHVSSTSPETSVICPICQLSFLLADVEMHAAYCEGDKRKSVDGVDQGSPAPSRKRRRRLRCERATESVQEKCYVCQRMVPLSSYNRHTQLCVQLSVKPARGTLLSALEQTDTTDIAQRGSGVQPGPSVSRGQPCPSSSWVRPNDIIELQDDDDDEEEEAGSLIRTFTEATDCLVDFRQTRYQRPKR